MSDYDAIVIGAGHNGLANATFLARAGLRVVVLEKNIGVGGIPLSDDSQKNWKSSTRTYASSLFHPALYRALDLGRFGLKVMPAVSSTTFKQDGDFFGGYSNPHTRRRELIRHSPRDADAALRFDADLLRWCRLVQSFLLDRPIDPSSLRRADLMEFASLLKQFHALSESQLHEFIRLLTMPIAEFLENYFENETIRAYYAGGAIIGTGQGVYSPGTAQRLLLRAMGEVDGNAATWGFARGGMSAVAGALASSFEASGGEIRTAAEVAHIDVAGGKATGVTLASGDQITADLVVSNLDPQRTFTGIMKADDVPPELLERARKFRIRGASGQVNIALDGMPTFPSLPEGSPLIAGHLHFTDTLERLERAYDDWKDDRWSADPYLDTLIPSLHDATLAPPGKHMMSVFVQYCPVEPEGGWDRAKRAAFGQTVIDQIARYSPDFKELMLHTVVLTPRELEVEVGQSEGSLYQGEPTLDQLFFNRPFPGYAQYRGPIKGMYLCGSSSHPGGAVIGAAGANAAREILQDLKRPDTTRRDSVDD